MKNSAVGESIASRQANPASVRLEQARVLRRVIRHSGQVDISEVIEPELITPLFESDKRFDHEYGRLGEELYIGLARTAYRTNDQQLFELVSGKNVLNGCYVLTKLLSYGPKAYAAYLKEPQDQPGSLGELATILKGSKDVLKLFADQDIKSNITYEINFGLLQYPPVYEDLPFIIEEEFDRLHFRPAEFTLRRTRLDIANRRLGKEISEEPPNTMHCPALGMVLNHLWGQAIGRCVEDPKLFPADLPNLAL